MAKNLMEVCEDMAQAGELEPYELGAGDVNDLFGEVFSRLTNQNDIPDHVTKAMLLVDEYFAIT